MPPKLDSSYELTIVADSVRVDVDDVSTAADSGHRFRLRVLATGRGAQSTPSEPSEPSAVVLTDEAHSRLAEPPFVSATSSASFALSWVGHASPCHRALLYQVQPRTKCPIALPRAKLRAMSHAISILQSTIRPAPRYELQLRHIYISSSCSCAVAVASGGHCGVAWRAPR